MVCPSVEEDDVREPRLFTTLERSCGPTQRRALAYIPLVDTRIRTGEVRIYMSTKQKVITVITVITNRSLVGVMLNQFKPDHILLWSDDNVVQ